MIQRIQSVYLILALAGLLILNAFPIAKYTMPSLLGDGEITSELTLLTKQSEYRGDSKEPTELYYLGQDLVKMKARWLLPAIVNLIAAVVIVSFFQYRNRVRQLRMVSCAFLLNVIYMFLVFFWAIEGTGGHGGYKAAIEATGFGKDVAVQMWTVGTIVPMVTLVLLVLAQRAIRSDEMKVRAADRLR